MISFSFDKTRCEYMSLSISLNVVMYICDGCLCIIGEQEDFAPWPKPQLTLLLMFEKAKHFLLQTGDKLKEKPEHTIIKMQNKEISFWSMVFQSCSVVGTKP